ncbi:titin [Dyadobacter sp. BE34]|uniref:Titin n=1 Tax=Dyadobacter fermentans TaxID=94254 RepID=A0ABU1QYK8_9BACT|nr:MULTISPECIES: fibronectin type III domain-containing protein [Dyadobacter]MDR6806241.1 titin [Dyadobacter fermentans]MDR7043982.1 titin [Dyadobacter sp. BE242]MDR7198293.1 titin [Dyadobacter sp. BE34]MDR7216256.1 titin [Dyadobacter sp. BE31]MDR7264218.1 titin [Dyadobacter sp. BE32]
MNRTFTRHAFPSLALFCIALLFPRAIFAAIPKAPATLVAVAASGSQINLGWLDLATDETGFEVEQSTDGTRFVKIADLAANTITYQDKSLKSATKYWYRVRAKNASGASAYSNVANATTLVIITIPKAPSALVANVASSTQINLSWTDNAGDETGFELERSTDALSFTKIADLGPNVTTYQHTGLAPATRYWYRVLAKNTAGKSGYSNIANATTQDVAPNPPSGLTAVAVSASQIDLKWVDNANNESGYQVERSQNGAAFTKIADLPANVTGYQSTGLAAATSYSYRVRAVNAVGASAYSNTGSAKTQNVPLPDAPTNLTAVPTAPDLIQLRWAKPTGNATEIVIERAKGEGNFVQIGKVAAAVLQYEDRAELEAADYFYRIKAVNAGGESPYSLLAIVRATSIITAVETPHDQHLIYMAGRTLVVDLNRAVGAWVSVYDLAGRAHQVRKISREGRIDLSGLPAGVYVVVTDMGKEVISKRIFLY